MGHDCATIEALNARAELVAHINGVVPLSGPLSPELVGRKVGVILGLPNTASVKEHPVNSRLESTIWAVRRRRH